MNHMNRETAKMALAYAALAYILASVLYMVTTRVSNVGTPLKDSYSEEQLKIKKKSSRTRGAIFMGSLAVSVAVLALWHPFK